jgi:hypothetical protein
VFPLISHCHLYYCLVAFLPCVCFCLQVIKKNKEERKERKNEEI